MNDERAFLQAILEHPADDGRKLVYADWLEEQGDPRAEYLRLMVKVRQERVITPEQRQQHRELSAEVAGLHSEVAEALRTDRDRSPESQERLRQIQALERQLTDLSKQIRQQVPARLQEVSATLDPTWLAVVSDPEIDGCGKTGSRGWRLHFDFVCDKTWADLNPTVERTVRHCETCSKNVHFCDNLADAREHSRGGHCIAVDLGIIRREGDLNRGGMFLGRPSPETVRRSYEEDMDPVSQARLNARRKGEKKRTRRR